MRRDGLCERFSRNHPSRDGGLRGGRSRRQLHAGASEGEGECQRIRFLSVFPPSVRSDPPWPATSALLASVAPPSLLRFICSRTPPSSSSPSLSAAQLAHIPAALLYGLCAGASACVRACVFKKDHFHVRCLPK